MKKGIMFIVFTIFFIISCGDSSTNDKTPFCPADCEEWESCSEERAECLLKEGRCKVETDCQDGFICDQNHTCVEDSDPCGDCGALQICVDGECVLPEGKCYIDTDCDEWESCEQNSNNCLLKEGRCEVENNCPDGYICDQNHTCIEENIDPFCETIDCGYWGICDEDSESCIPKEGYCGTDDDCLENYSCNDDHYCESSDGTIFTTIDILHNEPNFLDSGVETRGIVTAVAYSQSFNVKGVYIQDGVDQYSGIYIYFNEAGDHLISVGDKILVKGVLDDQFSGKRVRTPFEDIIIESSDNELFEPVEIDYFDNPEPYQSMVIKPILDQRFNLRDILPQHYVFRDLDNNVLYVKDTISVLNHLSLYSKITDLTGVLEFYENYYRVLPRSEADILIDNPVCEYCEEWQVCLDNDSCFLSDNRCELFSDCEDGAVCNTETHWCIFQSELSNGSLEEWDDINTPTNYSIGEALVLTQEDEKVFDGDYSGKINRYESLIQGDNLRGNFLSPAIAVDFNKSYTISLRIYDNDYDVDCRIYYEIYNVFGDKIGSGIPPSNDGFTLNEDSWQYLEFQTDFISHLWYGEQADISDIRFGVRVYKDHTSEYSTGTGELYIDNLEIFENE